MKIGNLVKTAIKFAPIIIPIVKKVMDKKKNTTTTTTTNTTYQNK
ncbi:hypothetical protein ACFPYN_04185 [Paenisporosarcina macmurdoensis]|uniref:Uncharacterized protein n=1 Tax=Paenisporosarcina macmurdoensis TaxID=212659 RepID=A0ABW1L3T3_9BACL